MPGPYYVDSTATGGSNTGGSWANAYLTFAQAVTAATTAGDVIYVASVHSESLGADNTTYTFGANVNVISASNATTAPTVGALIGAQATNYSIILAGAYKVFIYGVTFQTGTNTSAAKTIITQQTDGAHCEFESCTFNIYGSNSTSAGLSIGTAASVANNYTKFKNCTVRFSNVLQHIAPRGGVIDFDGLTVNAAGTAVTNLFDDLGNTALRAEVTVANSDLSHIGSSKNLVADVGSIGQVSFVFRNCKIGSGVTIMAAQTTITGKCGTVVTAYNCASDDTHYGFYHGDPFGSTTAQTTVYATAGAASGGASGAYDQKVGFQVVTTANCSFFTPYVGPWIAKSNTALSAITPSFELVRSGSSTAYNDWELWGEWSYQSTSGVPLGSFADDRGTFANYISSTTSAQGTGALAAGDWTGENATSWFGKLAPSAITPAEVGCIYGRVVVGVASKSDIYYDPQIRIA